MVGYILTTESNLNDIPRNQEPIYAYPMPIPNSTRLSNGGNIC
jgi:hypothetical protein